MSYITFIWKAQLNKSRTKQSRPYALFIKLEWFAAKSLRCSLKFAWCHIGHYFHSKRFINNIQFWSYLTHRENSGAQIKHGTWVVEIFLFSTLFLLLAPEKSNPFFRKQSEIIIKFSEIHICKAKIFSIILSADRSYWPNNHCSCVFNMTSNTIKSPHNEQNSSALLQLHLL
jgi:hypothetical protein